MSNWVKYWRNFYQCWCFEEKPSMRSEYSDESLLQKAGEELAEAYNLLSRVEDDEMIEYASLTIQAAEKRYDYLLRRVKEQQRIEDPGTLENT
ncbi:MAG: DUF2508 family protein [Bacillota bacterium]|nr:DUF2508 family protein [Bacillota bacterium]